MPTEICAGCGRPLAQDVEFCPKCGRQRDPSLKPVSPEVPLATVVEPKKPQKRSSTTQLVLGVIAVSIFGLVVFDKGLDKILQLKNSLSSSQPEPSQEPGAVPAETPTTKQLGSQWSYGQLPDPMSNGVEYEAAVRSTNTVNFSFPYQGAQNATLTLRDHPRYGKDVLLSIRKGQFLCPSYSSCSVAVRFDDENSVNYTAVGPEDNSSTVIFIRNYNGFLGKISKAKRVRISVPVHQEGSPVFEFDLTGFDKDRYKPKK